MNAQSSGFVIERLDEFGSYHECLTRYGCLHNQTRDLIMISACFQIGIFANELLILGKTWENY